ncbi:TadE/TadG family type IV pilus assembly protein [Massilia sp. LjRoot122]|uniref:TadE/TadG family type IV pilus assembly protein n=1 Tax=Massilia sp. LjRoot122 TaxID=3342257 RepID=UPI003ECDCD9C
MNSSIYRYRHSQGGLAAVEFALIAALILFPLLFGIIEFGKILFYWNAATEATRLGARLAVVCDLADSAVKSRMNALFPVIETDHIDIAYKPDGCTTSTCIQVEVSIKPINVPTFNPFMDSSMKFQPFRTTLPRESMRSSVIGLSGVEVPNPVCT